MIRKKFAFLLTAALLAAMAQIGTASDKDAPSDGMTTKDRTVNRFKSYVHTKKVKAVELGRELLQKTDMEIDKLQARASAASEDTKTAYQKEIENLRQKRAVAARKLDQLENASENSWDAMKNGFIEAYQDLYEAHKDALSRFR